MPSVICASSRPVVVLDPGHGPPDFGAYQNGVLEASYAYSTALLAKDLLAARGIDAVLTREAYGDPWFTERARIAKEAGACGVVVLHVNAGDPLECGPLAFRMADDGKAWTACREFIRAAGRGGCYVDIGPDGSRRDVKPMRSQIITAMPSGWTSRMFNCMRRHERPVVGLELEYCSNRDAAAWLLGNRDKVAQAVADCAAALVL